MSWEMVKMEDIFDIARGGSPRPIDKFITDDPDGVNWIMIGDTKEGGKYIEKTAKKIKVEGTKKSREVKSGDFLLTNSMSFGRPYILKISGCIHDGWLVLSPKSDQINTDYFYHYLGSKQIKQKLAGKAAGAVVKNLNKDIVKQLEIPLPPLAEQKRIAAILDKADSIRRKRQHAIQLADELLRAVFLDMFGDPVTNPKGLVKTTIGELCDVATGATPSRKIDSYYTGNIPWVKTTEVDGYVIHTTEEFISHEGLNNSNCKLNPIGSIVLAMYGQGKTRGKVGILGIEAATNQACAVIKPSSAVIMEYLYIYLKMSYESLRSLGQGAGQPNLNLSIVKGFPILLPSQKEQLEFVKIFKFIGKLDMKNIASTNEADDFFSSLSQKAFSGQL